MTRVTLDLVHRAMAAPRPGRPAQERMSPHPRPGDIPPPPPEHPLKEAGVLILLYLTKEELHFVLTRRTDMVAMHKGQISLPGGAREDGERLEDTALRETVEELDIDPGGLCLLGEPLTPLFIPVSGFWVTPFVGYWNGAPEFVAEEAEVIEVLEPRVDDLLSGGTLQEEDWQIRGIPVRVPFFRLQGHKVWGATAMILSEFAAMLAGQMGS